MFGVDVESGPKSVEVAARSQHRWLVVTILVLAISASFAAYHVLRQIEHQMERNATAVSDNRTWVFAQLEVDLLKLVSALADARLSGSTESTVERLREQFDILYSRVNLIGRSDGFPGSPLSQSADWKALTAPDGLIARTVPLIDGPDDPLIAAIPGLHEQFAASQPGIRRALVDTVLDVMGRGDQQRKNLRDTLRVVAIATLWLLFGVLTLMVGLYLQGRGRLRHALMLERAVENLRNTINSALDAVLILDADGRIIGSNRATESIFGGAFKYHHHLQDFLRSAASPARAVALTDFPKGQRSRLQCVRLDGSEFPAEASLASGSTGTGDPITVVFIRDISEQLAYEESLAEARNAALEADEAKARFLAVMSHEMRTPLNGLLSAVDLLGRTTRLDDEQLWLADIIRTCGQTTLEQVNNVLQLTRLGSSEAGDYPVSAFSLTRAVEDLAQQFRADALRNGTSLTVMAPEAAIGVELPLQLLRRALANLLSNAVKFTENGTIILRLAAGAAETPGRLAISIAVEDSGIGIDPADLQRIFKNFETLDASYVRVREGSGLGLGIAKLSVEAMGGRIEADSRLGEGSRFTIHLEAPEAEVNADDEAPPPLPELPLAGLSVLVAEDNTINRTLLARQLHDLGALVTAVVDGQAAVEAALDTCFDLVLMDVSMPRMDGLTATRAIRSDGKCRNVPVIAITAQAAPDRLEHYQAAGMTEVLTKPARVDQLVSAIQRHVPLRAMVPQPEQAGPDEPAGESVLDAGHVQAMIEDFGVDYMAATLETFAAEMEAGQKDARSALADRDLVRVRKLAHSSCGAAAVLGMVALREALKAQQSAADARDCRGTESLQPVIEALSRRSVADLRAAFAMARGKGEPTFAISLRAEATPSPAVAAK